MSEELTTLRYNELRDLADRIKTLAEQYKSIYEDRLYGSFKKDLKNAFKGDDAETAMGQLDGLNDDFDAMYTTIMKYSKHLSAAADAYEKKMIALNREAQNLTRDRKKM